jgi:ParB family chromosome partitioning protein
MPETSTAEEPVVEGAEPEGSPLGPLPASMIGVDVLIAHPGNVREDLNLPPQFLASVAESGVRIPLLVTRHDDGGYLVIEGHRRLAAALRAGLEAVPCVLDPGRAADQAGQFLDMVVANSDGQRRNFTPTEEAVALFAAHEAGASRTRIRKATGRKADEVKTALRAGGISAETRAQLAELPRQLTLDQMALLAEFDGQEDEVNRVMEALRHGYTVEYVAERIRQDRAEAAEHERLRAELEAAGVTVTDTLPAGACRLTGLAHDEMELTPESHATCPGRGAFFPSWSRTNPVHYCASPAEHGHTFVYEQPVSAGHGDGPQPQSPMPDPAGGPAPEPERDPSRNLVIEGNKAWAAAAEVRKRWLGQLFGRRSVPKEVARFVAGRLLAMPEPLRLGLATAHSKPLFTEIAGQAAHDIGDGVATCPLARLPLLMLAPIAVAYEGEMFGADANRRATWREDRYSPCSRQEAGRYLSFLASLGYQLSPIEQAVADDVPYTGDAPESPDLSESAAAGTEGGDAVEDGDHTSPEDSGDAPEKVSPDAA